MPSCSACTILKARAQLHLGRLICVEHWQILLGRYEISDLFSVCLTCFHLRGSVADLLAGVTHESVQCMQSRRRCCEVQCM